MSLTFLLTFWLFLQATRQWRLGKCWRRSGDGWGLYRARKQHSEFAVVVVQCMDWLHLVNRMQHVLQDNTADSYEFIDVEMQDCTVLRDSEQAVCFTLIAPLRSPHLPASNFNACPLIPCVPHAHEVVWALAQLSLHTDHYLYFLLVYLRTSHCPCRLVVSSWPFRILSSLNLLWSVQFSCIVQGFLSPNLNPCTR